MINWQSILSSFDDKLTLLEWLKKVQKALNESALTTVTVTQEKAGRVNSITLSFNFQDGTKIVAPAFTVQDGVDGIGITDLVNTNLTSGNLVVTYNTTDGIGINATMRQTYDGTNHDSTVDMNIPLVPGNGILIDKLAGTERVEVKLDQSKDIKIMGSPTNSVYFTSDSSASFGAKEGTIYSSFGNETGIPRIRQKDPGGNRIYTFPTNAYGEHTVLTSKNVKTLFGKSIVGSGNIDLYRHVIKITGGNAPYNDCFAYLTIVSSKKDSVESLADLKTLLGNTFEYPATGYDMYNLAHVYKVTQDGIVSTNNQGESVTLSFANMTVFTDTVTTV